MDIHTANSLLYVACSSKAARDLNKSSPDIPIITKVFNECDISKLNLTFNDNILIRILINNDCEDLIKMITEHTDMRFTEKTVAKAVKNDALFSIIELLVSNSEELTGAALLEVVKKHKIFDITKDIDLLVKHNTSVPSDVLCVCMEFSDASVFKRLINTPNTSNRLSKVLKAAVMKNKLEYVDILLTNYKSPVNQSLLAECVLIALRHRYFNILYRLLEKDENNKILTDVLNRSHRSTLYPILSFSWSRDTQQHIDNWVNTYKDLVLQRLTYDQLISLKEECKINISWCGLLLKNTSFDITSHPKFTLSPDEARVVSLAMTRSVKDVRILMSVMRFQDKIQPSQLLVIHHDINWHTLHKSPELHQVYRSLLLKLTTQPKKPHKSFAVKHIYHDAADFKADLIARLNILYKIGICKDLVGHVCTFLTGMNMVKYMSVPL